MPGGGDAWTTFLSTDMIEALAVMGRLRSEALSVRPDIAIALTRMMVDLDRDLKLVAARTAQVADDRIREKIRLTAKRPETEHPQHLVDSIKSEPLLFGSVSVGLLSELNKVENPETGGVYWRTQEEGSVAVGNQMTGRVLYGRFVGPGGYSEMPSRFYSGARSAPGSEFMFGALSGDAPGFGTIRHEVQPRHFLRDGSIEAFREYRTMVSGLSRRYGERIGALSSLGAY